jgi:CHAD domain-containing protein
LCEEAARTASNRITASLSVEEHDFAQHLVQSLKTHWKRYRRALKRCQRRFSEESVHDSRIETRRMLSALELFEAFLPEARLRKARRLFKRHLAAFSELRDTQVQLLRLARLRPELPDLQGFEQALRRRERRCITQARRRIERIAPSRLERQLKKLRAELKNGCRRPLRRLSLEAVNAAFREVVKRRKRVTPEDPATIHRTRVAFKHFRYMVEGLHGALRGVTQERLRAMQRYQAMMGEIQDHEVLLASLREYVRKERLAKDVARARFAELDRPRRILVARYLKHADALATFWPLPDPARRSTRRLP